MPSPSEQQPAGAARRRAPRTGWLFPAIALAVFLLLGAGVYVAGLPYFGLDLTVSRAVQAVSGAGLESVLRGICEVDNDFVKASVYLVVACLALVFLRARREAVLLFAVVLVGQLLCALAGLAVGRPRPSPELIELRIDPKEIEGFPSFPSGHTVHYTVFFGFLAFLALSRVKPVRLQRPLLAFFAGLVLLVGPARVYLGAHWFTDVLGGYLLGTSVLAAGINLDRRCSRSVSDPRSAWIGRRCRRQKRGASAGPEGQEWARHTK
jgi:undecaprenyl-diphosphatase